MKIAKVSLVAATVCLLATSAHALKTEHRELQPNSQVVYLKAPAEVNSFVEMFSQAKVYGDIRTNAFWWDWGNVKTNTTSDNNMVGLGANVVYKTAFYQGFGATVGVYGATQALNENRFTTGVNYGKAGKGTYRTRADGSEADIGVIAQGYGEYKGEKTDIKAGRQIIESTLLASNDSKMIPNTFEAVVIENKNIPDTNVRLGYITKQKLRDHQAFHSILAYDGTVLGNLSFKVNGNDDSGVHKGLNIANINKIGGKTNPEMFFGTLQNKSIPNLTLNGEYYGINDFFSTAIAEANYAIALGDGWTLTPGVRYLRQMDNGAGAIGGAALNGSMGSDKTNAAAVKARASYTNPNSVDGSILMERLVLAKGALSLMAGYSKVSDDADIIAPWRGFPTGGYTRSMAQVNWIANTKSWMVLASYDFDKAGIIPGLKAAVDYVHMNFDEKKNVALASDLSDRSMFHVDLIQNFKAIPNAEFKFRFATIKADPSAKTDTTLKTDYESYNEYRFEINYLF